MTKHTKQLQLKLDLPHVRKIDIVREFVDNNDHLGKLSEMSRKLKVNEGTVSCYIVALRKQGYEIEVVPPHGYTVMKRPKPIRGLEKKWNGEDWVKELASDDGDDAGDDGATAQDHNYAAVIHQYNDVKEDLKVAQQARVAMMADINQCREVIAGIKIDGPAALAHMEDLKHRHFAFADEMAGQRREIKKLKSRYKLLTAAPPSWSKSHSPNPLRAYRWTMIVLGSLISASLMTIAFKLWS